MPNAPKFYRGKKLLSDFVSSKAGTVIVEIVSEEGEETKRIPLPVSVIPEISVDDESGERTIDLKVRRDRNRVDTATEVAICNREMLSFVASPEIRFGLKEFFLTHPESEEALAFRYLGNLYISSVPENIGIITDQNVSSDEELSDSASVDSLDEKNDLKAYETPPDILSILLRTVDREGFYSSILEPTVEHIVRRLSRNGKNMEAILGLPHFTLSTSRNVKVLLGDAMKYVLLDTLGMKKERQRIIDEANDRDRSGGEADIIRRISAEMIERREPFDLAGELLLSVESDIRRTMEAGKSLFGMLDETFEDEETGESGRIGDKWGKLIGNRGLFLPVTYPIFDPQAGSGNGLLGAADEMGFPMRLKGFELRKVENDDPRYNVLTGVNSEIVGRSLSHAAALRQTMTAAKNIFYYLNPPYTRDQRVAKNTLKMLPDGSLVSGLFPESMSSFLEKNLSGQSLVARIPREVTGYEGKNIPSTFVFVIGTKFDRIAAAMRQGAAPGTIASAHVSPAVISVNTKEGLARALEVHFSQHPTLRNKVGNSFAYYQTGASVDRSNIFSAKVYDVAMTIEEMAKSIQVIGKTIQGKLPEIKNSLSPIAAAISQKIFPDTRFYNDEGEYNKYTFGQVIGNIPLLTFYRDRDPSMFRMIRLVAQEKKIKIPIDEESRPQFIFGQKPTGPKDKVTNMHLGMMRLYYYPSNIRLETEEEKETLRNILRSVVRKNGGGVAGDEHWMVVDAMIAESKNMILKSEQKVDRETGSSMYQDIFVLIDEFGGDIGKINIPPDEIYQEMEDIGLFSLSDYVEVAELTTEQKREILRGFVEDMEDTIGVLATATGADPKTFHEKVFRAGVDLHRRRATGKIGAEESIMEMLDFFDDIGVKKAYADLFVNDQAKFKRSISGAVLETIGKRIGAKKSMTISDFIYEAFNKNPILFYEDRLPKFMEYVKESIAPDYREAGPLDLEEDHLLFSDKINQVVSPVYKNHIAIVTAYSRMAEMILKYYTYIRSMAGKFGKEGVDGDAATEKTYEVFRRMFTGTLGLAPHQFLEAERYLALSDEKRAMQMAWEMRAGKSRSFMTISYLIRLYRGEEYPVNLVLEKANIPDIFHQAMESLPHLAIRSMFIVGDSLVNITPDRLIENYPARDIVPNPFMLIKQSLFSGGGAAVEEIMKKRWGRMLDENREYLEKNYLNKGVSPEEMVASLREEFKNSPLRDLLETPCQRAGSAE